MKKMALIFIFSVSLILSNTVFAQDYIYDRDSYVKPYPNDFEDISDSNISGNEKSNQYKIKKNRSFFELGPKAGVTLGVTYLEGISFRGGLLLEMPFFRNFGIQLNLTYSLYNVVFAGVHETQPDVYDSIVEAVGGKKTSMHYLDINPFFKFYIGPVWFGVGPAFSLAINGVGKQYTVDETLNYIEVPQKSMSVFGVYFSFGGVIKTGDLVYLLPEVYATLYPLRKAQFSPEKPFRFLTTEWVTFGFNLGIGFKIG